MNNIRLIQHDSNSSISSNNLIINTNSTTNQTQQPHQSLLSHNFQLSHATSSLQPNVALPPFGTPNAYAFPYPELYNSQTGYTMSRMNAEPQHLGRLPPEYAHELYSPESMLAQPHGSAFLQIGQPIHAPQLAHSFHGFQLKQESEPEPSSDESSFGEHNGVIRKVERIKGSKVFPPDKISVVTSELSALVQQNQLNHFCFVPGRLSLLSSAAKYEVTVAEISRRINPPESLNASVLGSILRRAKSKDGGKSLREKLKTHGLVLPAGQEASQLAGDFEKLCENEFPSRAMAEFVTRLQTGISSTEQRRNMIHAAKQLINEFCEVLVKEGSFNNSGPLDPIIQKPLSNFSLITHGFGSRAVNAGLNAFANYLNESLKVLDTK